MPESDIVIKVSTDVSKLQADMEKIKQQVRELGANATTAGKKIDQSLKPGTNTGKLKKTYDDLNRELTELNQKLREEIALKSKNASLTAKRINTLQKERDAIDRQANALTKTRTVAQSLRSTIMKLGIAFSAVFVARKTIQFFKQSVDASKRFESGLANLSALTGLAGGELEFMGRRARELSTAIRDDGIQITSSADDIVVAFTKMGSAQPELLKNKEALAEVTESALILAEAAKLDAETAINSLASTMNQFNADASQSTRFVNALAAGSKFGAQTVDFISASMTKFGAVAAAFNIPIEESVALIETMAEKGIQAEVSGTGIRTFLLRLAEGADETNPKVVGLQTALENLAAQNLTAAEMTKRFGQEGFLAAQILISQKDRVNDLTEAVTDTNTAYEQAAVNTDTLESSTKRLQNIFDNLKEAIGRRFTGSVISASNVLGKFLQKVTKWIDPKISEQLGKQVVEVNNLAISLRNANIPADERKRIYNELKEIAPEVVSGLDAENTNLVTLTKNLAEYNKQAINRLTVAKAYERLEEERETATEATLSLQDRYIKSTEIFLKLEKELFESGNAQASLLKTTRENYTSGAIDLWEYARVVKVASEAVWADTDAREANSKILLAANQQLELLADDTKEVRVTTQQAEEATINYNTIVSELGLNIDNVTASLSNNTTATIGNTDETKKNTKAKEDNRTLYERLSEEIDVLNKKLKDQILIGSKEYEETFNLIQLKKEQLTAVDEEIKRLELLIQLRADLTDRIRKNAAAREDETEVIGLPVGVAPPGSAAENAQAAEVADGIERVLEKGRELVDEKEKLSFIDGLIDQMFGLDGDTEQIDKIKDSLEGLLNTLADSFEEILTSNLDAERKMIENQIDLYDELISAQEERVSEQERLQKEGSASNVRIEKERLEKLQDDRDKAIEERRKQVQKERDIERTLAVVKAATAATEIIATAASQGNIASVIVGIVEALSVIATIATLFSTADSQIKYAHGTAQVLGGKSHSQGGTSLGEFGEAEKGEFLGILSKDKTQKYGSAMMTLFDGINKQDSVKAQMGLLELAGLQDMPSGGGEIALKEIPEIKGIYNEIKKQPGTVTYGNGYRIEKNNGRIRKIYVQ